MPEPGEPTEPTEPSEPSPPNEASNPGTDQPASVHEATVHEATVHEASVAAASNDPTGQVFVAADDAPPPNTDEDDESGPSALRTATVVSARIVLGVVTLAVIGVVVAAAILLPLPGFRAHPVSRVVTPTATAQQLVCPGGLLRLGSSTGTDATTATSLGSPRVTSGTLSGEVQSSDFVVTDAGTGRTSAAPRLLSIPVAPAGSAPSRLSGAQYQALATSDFSGLSSAACTAPSAGTWLVGGSTSVGRTTLLLLANSTAVAATVSVQVYGEVGQVQAPGMDGIQVAPGAQRVLSIAGFAPNVVSPVVHVSSTGGQVAAVLEQTTVRGLVPGGADFIGGAAAAETTNVIPGVVITGSAAVQAQIGQSGYDDLQTTLRLFSPVNKTVTASITVLAEDGSGTGKPTTTKISGGRVTDVPLSNLSDGTYTILVTSKIPLLASVRASVADSSATTPANPSAAAPRTDFAWMTCAPLLSSSALVSVPFAMGSGGASGAGAAGSGVASGSGGSSGSSSESGSGSAASGSGAGGASVGAGTSAAPGTSVIAPLLHLENPTAQPETVHVAGLDGTTQTITVAAKSATSVAVSAGMTYELTGFSHLYASVSGSDDGGITSFVVSPPVPGGGSVRIYG